MVPGALAGSEHVRVVAATVLAAQAVMPGGPRRVDLGRAAVEPCDDGLGASRCTGRILPVRLRLDQHGRPEPGLDNAHLHAACVLIGVVARRVLAAAIRLREHAARRGWHSNSARPQGFLLTVVSIWLPGLYGRPASASCTVPQCRLPIVNNHHSLWWEVL